MNDPLLTGTAHRYVARMSAAIAPHADRLDRRFRSLLRQRGFRPPQIRALVAITPAAASRHTTLGRFLEQVDYNCRRLAKLNLQPGETKAALKLFGALLDDALPGQFEPAREQLYLATVLTLHDAFYQVRENEAQTLFGLYRAEAEASDLDDLSRRFVRILTRTFRAAGGRLLLSEQIMDGTLSRPLYIERGDPREKLIVNPEMQGRFGSYWSFPISPGAVLQFGFTGPYPWLPWEAELLRAVGERCREAIEKARLRSEIRRLEVEARKAEEDERRRIGRELHDEAAQSLAVMRLQLEILERGASGATRSSLSELRATAERTAEELRRIVAALSPSVLERLGLQRALRQLAVRFRKTYPASVRFRVSGDCKPLPRQFQEVIYRVAQESLQNIAKHSQASRVNLLLRTTDKSVRLSISDNGCGFGQAAAESKPMSFGLAGMRERAALLRGNLTIRTAPGKGVAVLLELPQTSTLVTSHG